MKVSGAAAPRERPGLPDAPEPSGQIKGDEKHATPPKRFG